MSKFKTRAVATAAMAHRRQIRNSNVKVFRSDMYRELIIDLYKNPLNKREIKNANLTASGANPSCGDRLRVYLKINKKGIVKDASFEGEGCAISIAVASLLTEKAKGNKISKIAKWNQQDIFDLLKTELSPMRLNCGLLALETLQQAICRQPRI